MSGIKSKIVRYFAIIVLLTIAVLNVLLFNFVKATNYNKIKYDLQKNLDKVANYYSENLSSKDIEENIYNDFDVYLQQVNDQVQIQVLRPDRTILMDSIGVRGSTEKCDGDDAIKAAKGEVGEWIGYVDYSDYRVMAISYPLHNSNKEVVGIVRFVSSLEAVDSGITHLVAYFVIISVAVLLLGIIVSFIMAKGVIAPIKEVTATAKKMADGDLTVKSRVTTNDEVGQLAQTLNYMASELDKRDQLKNEFISSVSHELRTPLTAIKGWVITLNNDDTDKETLKMGFNIIEKESERLAVMVEELLDFSRLVSGKITLRDEILNVNELIDYITVYLSPRAEREGIEFIVNCEENVGELKADGDRLKQVLINIIDNAFKFTETGGEVNVHVYCDDTNVVIKVLDTGCGISEEELPRVKEKFYKGKNSKSQNGIGLSICDEIITLHGGTFDIFSTLDVGTEIYIKIPKGRQ